MNAPRNARSRGMALSLFPEIQALTARHNTAILVLAEPGDEASPFVAMGAQGVVYRSINGPSIVEAVRRLARGETFVHAPNTSVMEISEDLVGMRVRDRLTEKELRIVAAVVRSEEHTSELQSLRHLVC